MTPSPAVLETGTTDMIYLDNAATTPLRTQAADAVAQALELFGNPSSRHATGEHAHSALQRARSDIAALLGCSTEQFIVTGGGSEAINTALFGVMAARDFRGHLIISAIEHSAVLEAAAALSRRGVHVTVLPVTPGGHVSVEAVAKALRPDTSLVSIMHANNETGTLQPIQDITRLVHSHGALMHVDAVQTAGKLALDGLGADLLSVSAHKFGGPKGVGALRIAAHVTLEPLVHGGGQEHGRRAGTENTLGILGMAAAAQSALGQMRDTTADIPDLREHFLRGLAGVDGTVVNGTAPVMSSTVNVSFAGVRGDTLVELLDLHGIQVSTGSACHAADDAPSHVLEAMGVDNERAHGAVRFSFGHTTTASEIDMALATVIGCVRQLRVLSSRRTAVEVAS